MRPRRPRSCSRPCSASRGRARQVAALVGSMLALASAAPASAAPEPNATLPRTPATVAAALTRTRSDLYRGIDGWLRFAKPAPHARPQTVVLDALFEQRIYRMLARNDRLAGAAIARLGFRRRPARRRRRRRSPPRALSNHPADLGARHPYRSGGARRRAASLLPAGERRFGVRWSVLAAVNFVESAFDKLRNDSAAGAQGPMQFMPATWRAYGLGGDVHDPHDAILGAANYLHANGAAAGQPARAAATTRRRLYVDAVLRYARRIRADRRAFYELLRLPGVRARTPSGASPRSRGPSIRPVARPRARSRVPARSVSVKPPPMLALRARMFRRPCPRARRSPSKPSPSSRIGHEALARALGDHAPRHAARSRACGRSRAPPGRCGRPRSARRARAGRRRRSRGRPRAHRPPSGSRHSAAAPRRTEPSPAATRARGSRSAPPAARRSRPA